MKKTKGIGSLFESFLQKEGILEEVRAKALKTAMLMRLKKRSIFLLGRLL